MSLTRPYSPDTPSTITTDRGRTLPVPGEMSLDEFEAYPWPEGQRWELLEGVPVMSASPRVDHQYVLGELFFVLRSLLGDDRVIQGVDIRPPGTRSYVCPDLIVLGSVKGKMRPLSEAPQVAIEILSPSTASVDVGPKLAIYQLARVTEYWTVNPRTGSVEIRCLRDGDCSYEEQMPDAEGYSRSPFLALGFRLQVSEGSIELLHRKL